MCQRLQKPFPHNNFIIYSFWSYSQSGSLTAPNFPSALWIFYIPCTTKRMNVSSLQESMFVIDILLHVVTEPCQWLVLCQLPGGGVLTHEVWNFSLWLRFALNHCSMFIMAAVVQFTIQLKWAFFSVTFTYNTILL